MAGIDVTRDSLKLAAYGQWKPPPNSRGWNYITY